MFNILVLLSSAPESVKSLEYASNLCQNLKEYNLIILNTTPYIDHLEKAYNMEIEDEAQTENAKLIEILSKYSFEYEFTQIEGEGSVGEITKKFMDKHDLTFDLLLIGTKEKGKLEKYFVGSVSDYLMKGSVPVNDTNLESIPSTIVPVLIQLISTPTDLIDTVLLALRCLTNLIEVLPNASLLIQQQKGIDILLEKLTNLEFIDLAEQIIYLLHAISAECSITILKKGTSDSKTGGIMSCLQYLDFFSFHVQDKAMSIVTNACACLQFLADKTASIELVRPAVPILFSLLNHEDERISSKASNSILSISSYSPILQKDDLKRCCELLSQSEKTIYCKILQKYKYQDLEDFGLLDISIRIISKKESNNMVAIVDMLSSLLPPLVPAGIWKIADEYESNPVKQSYPIFVKLLPELNSIFSTSNTFTLRKKLLHLVCQILQNCEPLEYKPYLKSISNMIYETFSLKNTSQELLAIYYVIIVVLLASEADDQILQLFENEGIFVSMETKKHELSKMLGEIQQKKAEQKSTTAGKGEVEESEEEDSEEEYNDCEMASSITELPDISKGKSAVEIATTAPKDTKSEAKEAVPTFSNIDELQNSDKVAVTNGSKNAESQIPQRSEDNLLSRIKELQKQALPCNPIITSWTSEMILLEQLISKSVTHLDQCLKFSQSDNSQKQHHLETLLTSIQTLASETNPDENEIVHSLEKAKKIALYESTNYQLFNSNFVPTMVDFLTSPGIEDGHTYPLPFNQTLYSIPLKSRIELFKKVYDEDCKVLESIMHEFISKSDVFEIKSSTEYRYETISPSQINKQLRVILKCGEKEGLYATVPALGSAKTLQSYMKSKQSLSEESDDEEVDVVFGTKSGNTPSLDSSAVPISERPGNITGYNIFEQLDDVNMEEEGSDDEELESELSESEHGEDIGELADKRKSNSQNIQLQENPGKDVKILDSYSTAMECDASTLAVDSETKAKPSADETQKSKKPFEFSSEQSASTLKDESNEKPVEPEGLYFQYEAAPIIPGSTIFSVIYRAVQGDLSKIWYKTHTITYSKDKPESYIVNQYSKSTSECSCAVCLTILPNLPTDFTNAPKIFQAALLLLTILNKLYTSSITNEKLVARMNRQLADPILTISSLHPDWVWSIVYNFNFLLPFETKLKFFKTTHLGNTRNLINWLEYHSLSEIAQVRFERKKVVINRNSIFDTLEKVVNLEDLKHSTLEFEFYDEVGSGLGPTLEFYALVCKYFKSNELATKIWKINSTTEDYLESKSGLYPKPMQDPAKVLLFYEILGSFCAKAICDSRYLDLQFNPVIDPELYSSLLQLSRLDIDQLDLDFTLPSDPSFLLIPNGDKCKVNNQNCQEYIKLVVDAYTGSGVSKQVEAFRNGFSKILQIESLSPFSSSEIQTIISGDLQLEWTLTGKFQIDKELLSCLKADHGYTQNSRIFSSLCEMLVSFDRKDKRAFLSFVTGSPILPLGGLVKLNPGLTIVRKTTMKNESPDSILPSVMTCKKILNLGAHYLKVPEYSSAEIMKERFLFAMNEGKESFHLS
ncbi:Ubiquitin fusion degradation protein 4 [Boothiomyces sp. JEL0866]|nr:Ubiquitin fusion degradation protein 4 [Boothiomyces sp. JEL0866]